MLGSITTRIVKWHDEPIRKHKSQSPITLYPNSCYHEVSCVYKQSQRGSKERMVSNKISQVELDDKWFLKEYVILKSIILYASQCWEKQKGKYRVIFWYRFNIGLQTLLDIKSTPNGIIWRKNKSNGKNLYIFPIFPYTYTCLNMHNFPPIFLNSKLISNN